MLNIKTILKDKNITQIELAEMLGISRMGVVKTLAGNPTVETLQRIADALEVDILDLFEDNRPKKNTIACPHCGKEINIKFDK